MVQNQVTSASEWVTDSHNTLMIQVQACLWEIHIILLVVFLVVKIENIDLLLQNYALPQNKSRQWQIQKYS